MERPSNVRFGSKADIAALPTNVRFTPNSGHRNSVTACPLCAKSRHGASLFDRLVGPLRSWRHEESQVEGSEHQDNANIHYQPFPESVSEEREIYTDYNGCHRHHVKNHSYPSVHFSTTSFYFLPQRSGQRNAKGEGWDQRSQPRPAAINSRRVIRSPRLRERGVSQVFPAQLLSRS